MQQALSLAVRESQTVHPVRFMLLLEAALTSWGKSRELNVTVIEYEPALDARFPRRAPRVTRLSASRPSSLDLGIISTERVYVPHFCYSVQHRRMHAPLNNLSVGTLPLSILSPHPSQRARVLRATLRPLCTFVWRSTLSAPEVNAPAVSFKRNSIKTFQLYGKIAESLTTSLTSN